MPDFPVCSVWRNWCWYLPRYWLSYYKPYSFSCDRTVCICGAKCWNFYSQLVKKFHGFMKFRAHHWILIWSRWSSSHFQTHFLCDKYVTFIYCQVPLMRFFGEYFAYISYLSCVCYMSYPFTSLTFQEQMKSTDYEASLWIVSHLSATSSLIGP